MRTLARSGPGTEAAEAGRPLARTGRYITYYINGRSMCDVWRVQRMIYGSVSYLDKNKQLHSEQTAPAPALIAHAHWAELHTHCN